MLRAMKLRGRYKLAYRDRRGAAFLDGVSGPERLLERIAHGERRLRRILDSLRSEILEGGGGSNLRIRQVFETPREIYRLELELPELAYLRTTFLDRDALEELLAADDVRELVEGATLG
jgi:hypothetical protein